MTFTHVVIFTWHEQGFDDAPIARALQEVASGADGVRSYLCGADIGFTAGASDFAVVGTFADRESFISYRDDPEHQRILKEMILPNAAARNVVQLEA